MSFTPRTSDTYSNAASNTAALSLSGITDADLIVVYCGARGIGNWTLPSGYTEAINATVGSSKHIVCWKIASTESGSLSVVNHNTDVIFGVLWSFNPNGGTPQIDDFGTADDNWNDDITTGGVDVENDGVHIVGFLHDGAAATGPDSTPATGAPGTMTETYAELSVGGSGAAGGSAYYEIRDAGVGVTATMDWSSTNALACVDVAFSAPGGGGLSIPIDGGLVGASSAFRGLIRN